MDYHAAGLPECLRCLLVRHATSLTTLWRHRSRPLARFYLVGGQREENERASYTTGSQ